MTRSIQEIEAETMLKHIIENQPNLFHQFSAGEKSATGLALFCATFVHEYKKHLIDISNSQFPKKQP